MKAKISCAAAAAVTLFLFHAALFLSGQEDTFEDRIDIGTHSLFLKTRGHGSPAVVLDVGLGGSYRDWLPVIRQIARKTRVVVYDRAGYGRSDNGPFPRDCGRIAGELKKLLDAADIQGPYILAGHSLGGLNMQAFALKYPEKTAGLVLLDPPPLEWILGDSFSNLKKMFMREVRNLKNSAESAENSANPEAREQAVFLRTLASEHEQLLSGSPLVRKIHRTQVWKNLPLYVIASGRPNPQFGKDAEAFQKFWNEQCLILASKSSYGRYIFAPESGHHIVQDNPDLVLETLEKMLSSSVQKHP